MLRCSLELRGALVSVVIFLLTFTETTLYTCTNPSGCSWTCGGRGVCDNNVYNCTATASQCDLTCTNCNEVSIVSSAANFNINCLTGKGCTNLDITALTENSNMNLFCSSSARCASVSLNCPISSLDNCQCSASQYCNSVTVSGVKPQTTQHVTYTPTYKPTDRPSSLAPSTFAPSTFSPSSTSVPSKTPFSSSPYVAYASSSTTSTSTSANNTTLSPLDNDDVQVLAQKLVSSDPGESSSSATGVVMAVVLTLVLVSAAAVVVWYLKEGKYKLHPPTGEDPDERTNQFGFKQTELANEGEARPTNDDREYITERRESKKTDSTSGYMMTMVDRTGCEVLMSEPEEMRDISHGLMETLRSNGIVANCGIAVDEEESSVTHDLLYGPGRKLSTRNPEIGDYDDNEVVVGMETVMLERSSLQHGIQLMESESD